jgi:hypothetical protein
VALPAIAAGTDHTGYVLLSSLGRWLIEVRGPNGELGSLLLIARV